MGGDDRPTTAKDTVNNYVQAASYAPPGELAGMTNGASISVSNAYNSRLQPILLSATGASGSVFSECFDFHLGAAITQPSPCNFPKNTTGDNGNVYQIVNNRDNTRTQIFTYDYLNRIASAQSSGTQWGETYTIDAWGNLTNETGITGKVHSEGLNTSALSNNQLTGFSYDTAGNMINNGSALKYDAENRLVFTGSTNYYYDGDGNRVAKTSGSTGTLYWRGPTGDPLSESSLAGVSQEEYIFLGGTRIARRDVSGDVVHYYFSDHLGSHGVVENATGSSCEQDIDYYPFGAVSNDYCPSVTQHYRFTGKERDTESGLDEFGARYYSSSIGRFMIPDWAAKPTAVPYAEFGNPQSLNLYSYVENNPLYKPDLDGHGCPPDCSTGDPVLDFLGGAANAFGSDNLLGAGRVNETTESGKIGQAVGDFGATVQGGAEALFGGGVEVGGVALDATGVGAVAGVPANVAGAGLMLHGGATAETGFSKLFKSATQDGPYKRPSNATTPEQRASVQDKPCATCGATGQKNNADHVEPLVEQHYRGGIDKDKMRSPDAVRPQCQNCSNQQGGYLSGFSKAMKKLFGF